MTAAALTRVQSDYTACLVILAPRCGDIGDNPREYEYEPLTAPAVPEPITIPAPSPAPVPVKEPAHV